MPRIGLFLCLIKVPVFSDATTMKNNLVQAQLELSFYSDSTQWQVFVLNFSS